MPATRTLRRQLTRASLTTTLVALLLSSSLLLAYEFFKTRDERVEDLRAQADILAHAIAPALVFNDPATALQQLESLKRKQGMLAAEVYTADGAMFARYATPSAAIREPLDRTPLQAPGSRFSGSTLEMSYPVIHDGERVGTVVMRATHEVLGRIASYAVIQALAVAVSLGVALLVFGRMLAAVTEPLARVSDVAQEVMERRDWRLRAPPTDIQEIAILVSSFNGMLAEVQARTDDLEREMAERRRAEADLRNADRRKDEFLATLAHELRNPLAPMSNALTLLGMPQASADVRHKAVSMLGRQLRQMVRLIDDLLDVSRITTGKLLLHAQTVELVGVLRSAVEAVEPQLSVGQLRLHSDWSEEHCVLVGDAARLLQVFSNLLNNACRYTPPGGHIEVRASCRGEQALVTVRDTGIGIDPQMQSRIFDLFEQVDKGLERGNSGLGIGLTLARQLVRLHGGDIEVQSDGLGRGSCFTVSLPLPRRELQLPSAEPPAAPPPQGSLRLLVADDNVDFASSLKSVLESLGHRVRVVHNGVDALAAALADPPDAAVLDIGMPGLNGYDVAARLRGHPKAVGLPLIAVTGWGQAPDRDRAVAAGFDRHLLKPVDHEQLLAAIAAVTQSANAAGFRVESTRR